MFCRVGFGLVVLISASFFAGCDACSFSHCFLTTVLPVPFSTTKVPNRGDCG
jgi:hypothetical protein